jgi:hypothetical protein
MIPIMNVTFHSVNLLVQFQTFVKFFEIQYKTRNCVCECIFHKYAPHNASLKFGILKVRFRDRAYGAPHVRDETEKPTNVQIALSWCAFSSDKCSLPNGLIQWTITCFHKIKISFSWCVKRIRRRNVTSNCKCQICIA